MILDEDSFERKLALRKLINNCIISKNFSSIKELADTIETNINDKSAIYYITLHEDSSLVTLSYIDSRMAIYSSILKCSFPGYTMYWKTDDSIILYLNNILNGNTMGVSLTFDERNMVTKAEFNTGDKNDNKLNKLFTNCLEFIFPNAFIIPNRFINIDDIERIISSKIKIKKSENQNYYPIVFNDIFKKDRLIEYPKDSFDQYLQLLDSASKNVFVKSIYITLYRIGDDPAIYYILRDAVLNGKKVYVNMELYASGEFDTNTMWMNEMKKIGINVSTYMAGKVKVHSKLTLIKFSNRRSIAQIGTGNYHTKTTSQYTDLSLITSKPSICRQVENVFKMLNNESKEYQFDSDLLVTRYNFRDEITRLINIEAMKGSNGYICIKCNSLQDPGIIKLLDYASSKGCKIILIVRGVCTWIPNELGKNVIVKSIIWDKLEHSRVYCFGSFNPKIYLGSLDPVENKINKRIETLALVKDPDIVMRICRYLNKYIVNTKESWILTNSGMYIKE